MELGMYCFCFWFPITCWSHENGGL